VLEIDGEKHEAIEMLFQQLYFQEIHSLAFVADFLSSIDNVA
jgi:hypothetical protein